MPTILIWREALLGSKQLLPIPAEMVINAEVKRLNVYEMYIILQNPNTFSLRRCFPCHGSDFRVIPSRSIRPMTCVCLRRGRVIIFNTYLKSIGVESFPFFLRKFSDKFCFSPTGWLAKNTALQSFLVPITDLDAENS